MRLAAMFLLIPLPTPCRGPTSLRAIALTLLLLLATACAGGTPGVQPPVPVPVRLAHPGQPLWLTGTITEGITASPLQGATVTRLDGAGRARSDQEGRYQLKVKTIPGAIIRVRVSWASYGPVDLDVQLVQETTHLDVVLMPQEQRTEQSVTAAGR